MAERHSVGSQRTERWTESEQPPASAPLLTAGSRVEQYQVIRMLRRGGMGEVYLARDTTLGRKVALKLIAPELIGSRSAVERMLHEARTTAKFSHPNIVTIHGVGEHDGRPYIALEYLEGEDLAERNDDWQLSLHEALRIVTVVAEALTEAHRHGVLHRDLKPENIVIPRDGRPRVVDFGLAKAVLPDEFEAAMRIEGSTPKGTPVYMAPEQWLQLEQTPATDVWALGVILYELVTREPPFVADTGRRLAALVCGSAPAPRADARIPLPEGLADLIAACLSKLPDERPSAAEVASRLRRLIEPERIVSDGEASPYRGLLPFTRRHAHLFFGREGEIDEVIERLRLHPVLAVVGASGVGKSSFVRAGLIPRLEQQGRWRVVALRPGARPFRALAARLSRSMPGGTTSPTSLGRAMTAVSTRWRTEPSASIPPGPPQTLPPPASESESSLAKLLHEAPERLDLELRGLADALRSQVLLFVDQLEELFTLVEDAEDVQRFLTAIATAASDPLDPVRVIITVRDDFLGRMAASEEARAALTQVVVLKQLAEHDLVDVLVRPLELVGYRFEDATVPEDMVRSVIQERSSLPLLQFAAQSLWDDRDRDRRLLLRSAYERMGGVGGALARHADGVLDSLSPDEQALARQLFLRLVTPERTRRTVSRSRALDGLPKADMERVLARIVEARLVSVTKVRGLREPLLELAHESLITTWTTLARWLDESESDLALASEIEHAAQLWDKRGELWRGEALREATRALSGGSVEMSELARRFVDASQKRELRGRRQRGLLVALAFATLAAVAAGAIIAALAIAEREELAIDQRNEAQQQSAAALRESARAAWMQGSLLEARAKLRASLEVADSTEARALWWQLGKEQLAWKRTFGAVVRDIDFAPDGSFLFATMSDGTVYSIDPATSEGRALRGHRDDVIGGAISPDSQHVASASWDRTVRVWNARSGELERVLEGHTQGVLDVAFSPDGKLLASASFDTSVRIWQDGKQKHRIDAGTASPAVQFHPSGQLLAWSDMRGGVHLWDLRTRAPKRSMTGHQGSVYGLAFSPDGKLLASGSSDGTVRIWDVDSGRQIHLLAGHADTVSAISFRPDGKRIATGSWDHTVRVWNVSHGTLEQSLTGHSDHVPALAYSPDGRILASGSGDRSVRLWQMDKRRELTYGAHRGAVRGVALSPDGKLVVSGGMHGAIIVWDAATGAMKKQLTGHAGEVADVDIDPAGKLVASAGEDQTVRLWELPAGASKGRAAQPGRASSVAFHPDGSHVASGSGDGRVRLWSVEDLSVKTLVAGDGMVADVAFSPDGKRLAAAGRFPGVRLWTVPSSTAQPAIDAGMPVLFKTAFSPDGHRVAAVGSRIVLLELDSGAQTEVPVRGRPTAVAFARTGLVFGNAEGELWLQADSLRRIGRHRGAINSISVSRDGSRFATASEDGSVQLRHADDGRPAWRGPLLIGEPPRLFSHRGWIRVDSGGVALPPELGEALLARLDDARYAVNLGKHACVHTFDEKVELWPRGAKKAITRDGATNVAGHPEGCLAIIKGRAELVLPNGERRNLGERGALNALYSMERVVVVSEGGVALFDAHGAAIGEPIEASGVALAMPLGSGVLLGYANGSLEHVAERTRQGFHSTPSSMPVSMLMGPQDNTVFVGFANGEIGLWSVVSGARLADAQLHGAAVHLLLEGQKLYAATELGQSLVWELGAFYQDYCALMNEVWTQVPLAWQSGRASSAPRPDGHACAARK